MAAGAYDDEGALAVGGFERDGADELGGDSCPVETGLGALGGVVVGVGVELERDEVLEATDMLEVGVGGLVCHLLEDGLLVVEVPELAADDGVVEWLARGGTHLPLGPQLVGLVADFVCLFGGCL